MAKRALGVDWGKRRIGLALSDPSGLLARPFKAMQVSPQTALARLLEEVETLARDDDGLAVVVVGVPRQLDGTTTDATAAALALMDALRERLDIPVVAEDERLSSREAEARLAIHEKDWRRRKAQLDAAAAAVFLQDFLDRQDRTSMDVAPSIRR